MLGEDFGKAEIDAIESASKRVENMLKRPDQLERVEQFKRREARKKASVEARLKTAMQSQLDGVRTGLTQLSGALNGIKEIRTWVHEVDVRYRECAELTSTLGEVKEVASQHSQLAAAVENLKHIFTVPENVKRTEMYIEEEKLLHAHKGLMELESSRDDLLYELHKQPSDNPTDNHLLQRYFSEVAKLSDMLFKQIRLVLQRHLLIASRQPQLVVTCLRIIEREERIDKKMSDREKMAGFKAPGRPKNWRKRCIDELKKVVNIKIEGSQLEDRSMERMWLVRHLELIRQYMVEDLQVVKYLCVPLFPPDYKIFEFFIKTYIENVSGHLQDLIGSGLEHNEIIQMLTWITEFKGPMLLGHPELGIDIKKEPDALSDQMVEDLQQEYMKTLHTNIQFWMANAMETDTKDWNGEVEPDADGEGYFRTQLAVIIFQMIEQNLQVSNQISKDLTVKVVLLCVEELQLFIDTYRDAIRDYKTSHMADRSQPRFFFQYMVAIVNNFHSFIEFTKQLERRHLKLPVGETGSTSVFQGLIDAFNKLAGESLGDLLWEMFLDLEPHLNQIITRPWFQHPGSPALDTVSITIEDYHNDFIHLRPNYFESLIKELEKRTVTAYVKAMLEKRMTFRTYEERKEAAEKITRESDMLERLFSHLKRSEDMGNSQCQVIPLMTEVIRMEDTSMLSLEISTLVHRYSDIRTDHLVNLLVSRGDFTVATAKQVVIDTLGEDDTRQMSTRSIFSDIPAK
ncbi:exocyst complex component 3 [Strongylocentrotus purpuratus]|uniref:Exocyst complex component Sec6 n=1 Tax=Strongylocentrotus purpuratus TaxID=7668 RepID=A0A7M7STK0_STRPU|nr:exocyst complex component 3 [Strongylocentrotus purpuratus]